MAVTLTCSRCGLSITPRFAVLAPELCPRCVARNGVAVLLDNADRSMYEAKRAGGRGYATHPNATAHRAERNP